MVKWLNKRMWGRGDKERTCGEYMRMGKER